MQLLVPAVKLIYMSNIVDVIGENNTLMTMAQAVKSAGLDEELKHKGPYTLLAPSEIAFGKLPGGELAELLKPKNRIKLTSIINSYIIVGKRNIKDLKSGQLLKTRGGQNLDVKVRKGQVIINGAAVQEQDMEASNGVVHAVDKVVMPPGRFQ